jgi:hypothetical protein
MPQRSQIAKRAQVHSAPQMLCEQPQVRARAELLTMQPEVTVHTVQAPLGGPRRRNEGKPLQRDRGVRLDFLLYAPSSEGMETPASRGRSIFRELSSSPSAGCLRAPGPSGGFVSESKESDLPTVQRF